MHVNTLIIGAGPGGLACAKSLAQQGHEVLVLERKQQIGQKVCAGGITYSGLVSRLPETLVERSFSRLYLKTTYQSCLIEENKPIIATISREKLGTAMAKQAKGFGAMIRTGINVRTINDHSVLVQNKENKQTETISFDHLVGADGSSSLVRRYLGLKSEKLGVGINYFVQGKTSKMEWHLNTKLFANGYAWIFPHANRFPLVPMLQKRACHQQSLKLRLFNGPPNKAIHWLRKRQRPNILILIFRVGILGKHFLQVTRQA